MLLFVRGDFPVTIRLSVPDAASGISDAAGQPPDLAVRGQPAPGLSLGKHVGEIAGQVRLVRLKDVPDPGRSFMAERGSSHTQPTHGLARLMKCAGSWSGQPRNGTRLPPSGTR